MQPVQEILSRIRWDPTLAGCEFKIGYYDRVDERIILVPFKQIHFPKDDHFAFEVLDTEGEIHSIPYHRVRKIYQDGHLIWQRQ